MAVMETATCGAERRLRRYIKSSSGYVRKHEAESKLRDCIAKELQIQRPVLFQVVRDAAAEHRHYDSLAAPVSTCRDDTCDAEHRMLAAIVTGWCALQRQRSEGHSLAVLKLQAFARGIAHRRWLAAVLQVSCFRLSHILHAC